MAVRAVDQEATLLTRVMSKAPRLQIPRSQLRRRKKQMLLLLLSECLLKRAKRSHARP